MMGMKISNETIMRVAATQPLLLRLNVEDVVLNQPGAVALGARIIRGAFERTVTFNANGGTVSPRTLNVVLGTQVGALPDPTREHHTFLGWFSVPATEGGIERKASFIVYANITFFARWRTDAPTVRNPRAGATIPRQAFNATWDLIPGASYTIQMRNLSTDTVVLTARNVNAGTTHFRIEENLLVAGNRYRIAVSSVTANAVNGWSEREFSVQGRISSTGYASPNSDMVGFDDWHVPTSTTATSGLRGFGGMGFINNRWHMGSDFYASGGRDVVAVMDGLVMRVRGPVSNSGTLAQSVIIRHEGPFTVLEESVTHIYSVYQVYGPDGSSRALFVQPGERVVAGQLIARNGTLPLHFEVRRPSGNTPPSVPDDHTRNILTAAREIDWNYHIDPRWIFTNHTVNAFNQRPQE